MSDSGFTTVASVYQGNMHERDLPFSHNPEWCVATSNDAVGAAVGADQPFFLYYASTSPNGNPTIDALVNFDVSATPAGTVHNITSGMPARADMLRDGGSNDGDVGAVVVDRSLAALMANLESLGVLDETLIILTLDHGQAAKDQVFEGGARVALMARYPPSIQAGSTFGLQVNNIDLAPTILDAFGLLASTSLALDGLSWWGEATGTPDTALRSRQCTVSEIYQKRAVICGRYKLISNHGDAGTFHHEGHLASADSEQFYDLAADPAEQTNLALDTPEALTGVYLALKARLVCHDSSTGIGVSGTHPGCRDASAANFGEGSALGHASTGPASASAGTTLATAALTNPANPSAAADQACTGVDDKGRVCYALNDEKGKCPKGCTAVAAGAGSFLTATPVPATLAPATPALGTVPAQGVFTGQNFVLHRVTDSSVTLTGFFSTDVTAAVRVGTTKGGPYTHKLLSGGERKAFAANTPGAINLSGLSPDTQYYYQVTSVPGGETSREGAFHTARPAGSDFAFTVTFDPHIDEGSSDDVYRRTLANVGADAPDWHLDLGDLSMVTKCYGFHMGTQTACDTKTGAAQTQEETDTMWARLRPFIGQDFHSIPFLHALGNHEGEDGARSTGQCTDLASIRARSRTAYFPNPDPALQHGGPGFFSGDDEPASCMPEQGRSRQGFYTMQWGDVQLWVLDPFFYRERPERAEDEVEAIEAALWAPTLGAKQYTWLAATLQESTAAFKVVAIHSLLGGHWDSSIGPVKAGQGRGGAEIAGLGEWGGHSHTGEHTFAQHRDTSVFTKPVHDLLKDTGVKLVLHGHDHMYAKQELDGVVYQLGPQPSHPSRSSSSGNCDSYGYNSWPGTVCMSSSGHLRMTVAASGATKSMTVDYVRAGGTGAPGGANGQVAHSYAIVA